MQVLQVSRCSVPATGSVRLQPSLPKQAGLAAAGTRLGQQGLHARHRGPLQWQRSLPQHPGSSGSSAVLVQGVGAPVCVFHRCECISHSPARSQRKMCCRCQTQAAACMWQARDQEQLIEQRQIWAGQNFVIDNRQAVRESSPACEMQHPYQSIMKQAGAWHICTHLDKRQFSLLSRSVHAVSIPDWDQRPLIIPCHRLIKSPPKCP